MEFLVCISKTPDTTAKIAFDAGLTRFVEEGVSFILNPYDEWYALVRAVELKEKLGGKVSVVHVGEAGSDQMIRKALAIGADHAYRIDCKPKDSYDVAQQIAEFCKGKSFELIFLGKETIDHNGSEVGAMLAGLLDLPFVSYCNKLEVEADKINVSREVEGGVELSTVSMPCVVSAAKGLAEQRIPNMKGIMESKNKPLEVLSPVNTEATIVLEQFELPPAKTGAKMIAPDDIDGLVNVLKNDLKLF